MLKDILTDKVDKLWEECQDRNIGSNEAELDFKASIVDLMISESYSILITDIPNFRKELITMIEQLRYQTGGYNQGSSTEIAERFEYAINSR